MSHTSSVSRRFQSSPGPRAGRCGRARSRRSWPRCSFNPRPARGPGAARTTSRAEQWPSARFNPRPARGPGAAGAPLAGQPVDPRVSILARPAGRALRVGEQHHQVPSDRFNPRPARGPGAAVKCFVGPPTLPPFQSSPGPRAGRCERDKRVAAAGPRVSILARPAGRALPKTRLPWAVASWPFQSSPGPRAGRCRLVPPPLGTLFHPFQSSPGPRAGRCASTAWDAAAPCPSRFNPRPARGPGAAPPPRAPTSSTCRRFNPRPARGPGAATHRPIRSAQQKEFQSSPGPRAGRCDLRRRRPRREGDVSILARPAGRALRSASTTRDSRSSSSFNPRPARGPGAAVGHEPAVAHLLRVSILARPAGRALLLCRDRCRGTVAGFNPRPARGPGAALALVLHVTSREAFQSSPGPRAGRCPCRRRPRRRRR